ncbi:hypothetical protein EG68_11532 [Paragonimus skrjabini miyazakii]|uniref:Uncharacterized protein n=1 Tax=Paragonimus skrjabini miyazakii TaxID=59628 RepID=A0A8S9YRW7_9TREM|nr:hypothetical protein EG68_11532 [Paragonimus skrjabini miyazakii]
MQTIIGDQNDEVFKELYARELEYNLLEEVLLDMTYDAELGFLSPSETQLLEVLSAGWAAAHLQMHADQPIPLLFGYSSLSKKQQISFFSRVEDKFTQRLEAIPVELTGMHFDNCQVRIRRYKKKPETARSMQETDPSGSSGRPKQVCRSRFNFSTFYRCIQTISQICSVTSRLFSETRNKTQTRSNLLLASVLLEEAECLSAQMTNLEHTIPHEARKHSDTLDYLKRTKNELNAELQDLNLEVSRLNDILAEYRNQDLKYHDLVRRYRECQQQLALRCELLGQQHYQLSTESDPHSSRSTKCRRSLSLSSLPQLTHRL